jgi:hypothetical protein
LKRLYTFGCSFTHYDWPTWADILSREFDYYENWGLVGGGNEFILNSLVECLVKNKLTKNDQVIIMWSNITREDRYVNDRWLLTGNIFTQTEYSEEFVKKYADEKGYLLRDLSFIHAASKMLEQYHIPYIFTSMVPIDNSHDYEISPIKDATEILDAYQETIKIIRPSIFETVFNFDWWSRSFMPDTEMKYLTKKYNQLSGVSWPKLQDYLLNNIKHVSRDILDEIKNSESINLGIHRLSRRDLHPNPLEHLEYVDKVLTEFVVSDQTKQWVNEINLRLESKTDISDMWTPSNPNRW